MEFNEQIFSNGNLRNIEEKPTAQIICNENSNISEKFQQENKIYTELALYKNKTNSTNFDDNLNELNLKNKDRQSSSRIESLESEVSVEYSEEDSEEIDLTSGSGSNHETESIHFKSILSTKTESIDKPINLVESND